MQEPDWKALQEFQKQVAATMVVDSLVVTPKEKFERAAPARGPMADHVLRRQEADARVE